MLHTERYYVIESYVSRNRSYFIVTNFVDNNIPASSSIFLAIVMMSFKQYDHTLNCIVIYLYNNNFMKSDKFISLEKYTVIDTTMYYLNLMMITICSRTHILLFLVATR